MRCGEVHRCICGDRLIHQNARRHDESSSPFGQFIVDTLPNSFFRVDDDQATHYKLATKVWRDIEHKFTGQKQSAGQTVTMAKRARATLELVRLGLVHEQSGSFVVTADPPYEHGVVQRVDPSNGALLAPTAIDGDVWQGFLTGAWVDV